MSIDRYWDWRDEDISCTVHINRTYVNEVALELN